MAKQLKCGDLMPGCSFSVTAETVEEVLQAAAMHAREVHGLEVTPELAEQVKLALREVSDA